MNYKVIDSYGNRVYDPKAISINKLYTPMADGVHAVRVKECLIGNGGSSMTFAQIISFRCQIAGVEGEWAVRFQGCAPESRYFYLTPEDAKEDNKYHAVIAFWETFSYGCHIHKYHPLFDQFPKYLKRYDYPTANNCYVWNGCKAVSGLAYNYEFGDSGKLRAFAYDLLNHRWPDPINNVYPTAEACEADNACKVIEFDDDEEFAERKREEFEDYVRKVCGPEWCDMIDWEYFMNLKSMPENLSMQINVWTKGL